MNYEEGYGKIEEHFATHMSGTAKYIIGDTMETSQYPIQDEPWVVLEVHPGERKRISLGGSKVVFRYFAIVYNELFTRQKIEQLTLTDKVVDIFSSNQIENITIGEPTIKFLPKSNGWYPVTITHSAHWTSVLDNPVLDDVPDIFIPAYQFFNERNSQYMPLL